MVKKALAEWIIYKKWTYQCKIRQHVQTSRYTKQTTKYNTGKNIWGTDYSSYFGEGYFRDRQFQIEIKKKLFVELIINLKKASHLCMYIIRLIGTFEGYVRLTFLIIYLFSSKECIIALPVLRDNPNVRSLKNNNVMRK